MADGSLSEVISTASPRHPRTASALAPEPTASEAAPPDSASPNPADSVSSDALQSLIDATIASLRKANIAFNTPKEIPIATPQTISLLLSFEATEETLRKGIEDQGLTQSAQIPAAPEMEALLSGSSGLTIRALQPESVRAVPSHGMERWDWEVEGTQSGPQMLTLSVSVVLANAPNSPKHNIQTFARTLSVTVSSMDRIRDFIAHNWQWLWTVLIIPLAGLIWRRISAAKRQ
jgi:hypothetical protein